MIRNPIRLLWIAAAAALVLGSAGCAEDTETNAPKGSASMQISSSNAVHSTTAGLWERTLRFFQVPEAYAFSIGTDAGGNTVELTDFQVAIREIKFKSEDDDAAGLDADSVDFEGPYALDLLDSTSPLAQTLGETQIPAGVYDGVRFVMHKADELDPTDVLFGRSVYIEGTVDRGSGPEAFVMWHDTGENFDLFGTNGLTIEEDTTGNDLVIDFKLLSLMDGIDFTAANLAEDISPDAVDTNNKDIADLLKDNVKAAADFGEDTDGDGVVSEDEDVD